MRRFVGSSLMALIASSVLFSSTSLGASDAVHKASATHSALKGLCTKKALQSYAPVGLVIKKIPDLNPLISAVVKTTDGVTYVPAGFFGDGAPEYCVVTGSIVTNSSTGKSANFGVALPAPGAWRQRLLMQGCGGNCGDVFDSGPPAPTLIQRGYAVWTTDDGHVDSGYAVAGQPALADSRWALAAAGRPNADAVEPGKPVVRTLPLCQFPAQARYQGSGDLNDGSSWSCPAGDQRLLTVGSFGSRGGL